MKIDNTKSEDTPQTESKSTKTDNEKKSASKQSSKTTETIPDSSATKATEGPSADFGSKSKSDEVYENITHIEKNSGDMQESDNEGTVTEQLAAERDKYLRLAAEYDNYRKRSSKEREMTYSDARIESLTKLLPIYDNFERALQMECADEAFYKGIEMIMSQFNDLFENMGVKHIPALGESFDPNRHNAVMMIKDPNLGENIIAEEYQKGFTLGERVIRFSTVVVAN